MKKKFVVVGGGFTGLATAFYLRRHGWHVELFEKNQQLGGCLRTEKTQWGLVEAAANGLLNSRRIEELFDELKLELLPARKESRRRYFYRQGARLWPLSL